MSLPFTTHLLHPALAGLAMTSLRNVAQTHYSLSTPPRQDYYRLYKNENRVYEHYRNIGYQQYHMKRTAFILALILSAYFANAQGSIKGSILDSASGKPLAFATVTVFKAADTALVTYRLSSPEGDFKIPSLPLHMEYRVVITYSGYHVYRKVFTLTSDQVFNLDTIRLAPTSGDLEEVLVLAERPPVTVRKDTIEFNAASFKTLPTALVEDMLKKLPGVEIDAEGNITANGKRVNRILVDGKEFFGNDPKMATRNLPANVIDKIQLTEDKDERDLNPDKPAGEIGQVINLKLKKGIKKGWFGKAYAGYGTDERYEGGTMLNLFRDTMQLSLIGFSNNLNRAGFGFNDIRSLGGFDRSGINMMMMNSNGGINVNGISFGGTGEGINTSTGAGFNMNHVLKNGFTLNSQYFYGQTKNDIIELNNRRQFLHDTILNTLSRRNEDLETFNHRIGLGLKGKIDSLSRFEFKPSLTLTDRTSQKLTYMSNTSNFEGPLNQNSNQQQWDGKDLGYDHQLMVFKNFKKTGRSLNINHTLYNTRMSSDQVNEVLNEFYNNGTTTTSDLSQLRKRIQANFTANFNATWSEPLTKALSLRAGYMGTLFKNDDDVNTFNEDPGTGKHDIPNPDYTNGLSRKSWRNTISGGLNWKYKKLSITASALMQFLDVWNHFEKSGSVNQHYQFLLPGFSANWKEYNFNYNASVSPPGITDLQPAADNTNPLFIVEGNPSLEPALTHSFHFNYFKNVPAKTLFLNFYMHGNMRDNAITRSREVLPNGVQRSRPVNVDGNHEFYTNANVNKQYKFNKNFQVTFGGGYNLSYNRNYLLVNDVRSYVKTFDIGPRLHGGFNWRDVIESNVRYHAGWNSTRYENGLYADLKTNRSNVNYELVLRWPKRIVWEGNMTMISNAQTAPGVKKDINLLNASVTLLFLKGDKGQLKLWAYDLLDENVSVFRNTTENMIVDRQINMLQRYFMATFTYNIRDFKGGKVGGTQRLFIF